MQEIQVFLYDENGRGGEIDLSTDDPISLTYMINDLSDVKNQNGNTSNQFKVPLTARNRSILGYPDDITITNLLPYRQYHAKFVQNGVELIRAGIGELKQVDNNFADLVILSGNVDFFDSIDGQIYDMGDSKSVWSDYGANLVWKPYDHQWNLDNIVSSQQKTSGWIWPIVDYGQINKEDFSHPIMAQQMRPGFFVKDYVNLLCEAAEYEIDTDRSSLMKDPLYQKLIVQFANDSFEHGSDYQNTPTNLSMSTYSTYNQQIFNRADGQLFFTQSEYAATQYVDVTVTLTFDLFMRGYHGGSYPSFIEIRIVVVDVDGTFHDMTTQTFYLDDRAQDIHHNPLIGQQNFLNNKITYDLSLVPGMKVRVYANINHIGGGAWDTFGLFYNGANFLVQAKNQLVLWDEMIQCERIFPDISQKDMLKAILQKFAIICQSNDVTKKITFASFRDIVGNIPVAKDWTDKMTDQGKQRFFQLGKYSQINWMRYAYDDSIPLQYLTKYFGDDHIDIDDKTLNPGQVQSDLFNSPFSPSINVPFYGGTIAQILKIDVTQSLTDFSIGTQPRILVDHKYQLKSNEAVTIQGPDGSKRVINDVISVPYFYKPGGDYNLCFCDKGGQPGLRSKYYPEVEHVLKYSKKIVRWFMLTPRDIAELDLLIPVFLRQEGGYFYISKIDSWVKGHPVKVELIRL